MLVNANHASSNWVLVSSWALKGQLLNVSDKAKNGTACKNVLGETTR